MAGLGSISPEDRNKFKNYIDEGLKVLQQIEDMKGGLKDVTKSLAEEFGLAPAKLNASLNIIFKNSLADKKEEMDVIEEIIHMTGHA